MPTTIFNFSPEHQCHDYQHFIYNLDEQIIVQCPNDFNKLPTPLPSKLYLHIVKQCLSYSVLYFTDEMHAFVDVPEDDFWLIENQEYTDGIIHTRILLDSEKMSTLNQLQPYSLKTYFKLRGGHHYQIRYKNSPIIAVRAQQYWKIVSK
jgi:hypothetical protein